MLNLRVVLADARVKEFINYYELSGNGVVDLISILDRVAVGTLGLDKPCAAKKVSKKQKVHRA